MSKTALVTGGTRGIGLGIARALSREGFDLALSGVRSPAQVAAVLSELGGRARYFRSDVSDGRARKSLLAGVKKSFGRLDLLVNNAGVAPEVRADLLEATEESFDRLVRINLKGPYFLTQLAARWMIEEKRAGCIINIGSVSSSVASVTRGDYCLTKAAVTMATRLWAVRLAGFGIPVYEIQPGLIKTDMTTPAAGRYEKLIASGALLQSRWGSADEVGRAVAMLARGDLPYSTGQVLMIDGGLALRRL